ncbi:hypothetical protein IWW57_006388, partial [Coemansia sp. S610]
MTEALSPFQTLPWNIVNTIIKHTITEECQVEIVFRKINKQRCPYDELLSICHIWRQLVLERLWKKYLLNVSTVYNE